LTHGVLAGDSLGRARTGGGICVRSTCRARIAATARRHPVSGRAARAVCWALRDRMCSRLARPWSTLRGHGRGLVRVRNEAMLSVCTRSRGNTRRPPGADKVRCHGAVYCGSRGCEGAASVAPCRSRRTLDGPLIGRRRYSERRLGPTPLLTHKHHLCEKGRLDG